MGMPFITFQEIFDIILMTFAVGFIFKDTFPKPRYTGYTNDDELLTQYSASWFNWNDIFVACLITAPGVIFHELAHKFVALAMGIAATFHAAYFWLTMGIILKLVNFGFIFFIPGYVSHGGDVTPLQSAAIAFAGPFLNLVLWLGPWAVLKAHVKLTQKWKYVLILTRQINMFLFIFNMLPIPPFDGWHFFTALFQVVF